MALPTLDEGHRLLACLAVAIREPDPVLVRQIAEKADKILPDSQIVKTFGRLKNYGVGTSDLNWLEGLEG